MRVSSETADNRFTLKVAYHAQCQRAIHLNGDEISELRIVVSADVKEVACENIDAPAF